MRREDLDERTMRFVECMDKENEDIGYLSSFIFSLSHTSEEYVAEMKDSLQIRIKEAARILETLKGLGCNPESEEERNEMFDPGERAGTREDRIKAVERGINLSNKITDYIGNRAYEKIMARGKGFGRYTSIEKIEMTNETVVTFIDSGYDLRQTVEETVTVSELAMTKEEWADRIQKWMSGRVK